MKFPVAFNTPCETVPIVARNKSSADVLFLSLSNASQSSLEKIRTRFLHKTESSYCEKLKLDHRRHSYLLGRWASKNAVKAYLGQIDTTDIYIGSGVFRQPVLYGPGCQNVGVGIGHSADSGISIVFPEKNVMGVDIETVDADRTSYIHSTLTEHEKALAHENDVSFYTMLWTIKEALAKTLKVGLNLPLSILEVDNQEFQSGHVVSTYKNFPLFKSYSFVNGRNVYSIVCPKSLTLEFGEPLAGSFSCDKYRVN